jgi:hypothetical protein
LTLLIVTARRLLGLDVGVDIILEETSKEESGAGPSSGLPIRQSRRIAQIKIKEEAERRKLEELTLLELKEQQRRRKRDEKHDTKVRIIKLSQNERFLLAKKISCYHIGISL